MNIKNNNRSLDDQERFAEVINLFDVYSNETVDYITYDFRGYGTEFYVDPDFIMTAYGALLKLSTYLLSLCRDRIDSSEEIAINAEELINKLNYAFELLRDTKIKNRNLLRLR